jgi:hypothetical protein
VLVLGVALAGTGNLDAQSRSGGHSAGSHTPRDASTAKPGSTTVTQPGSKLITKPGNKSTSKTGSKTTSKAGTKTTTKRKKRMAGSTDQGPGLITGTVMSVSRSKQDTAKGTIKVRPAQLGRSKGKSTSTASHGSGDVMMQVSQATQYMSHQHRWPRFEHVQSGDQVRITADGRHALQVEILSSRNSTTSSKGSSTRPTRSQK